MELLRAAKAKQAREMIGKVQSRGLMAIGGYDSGKPRTRLRAGQTQPQGGSAQSHLDYTTRGIQRKECQNLERNNLIARACVSRWVDFAVGDGPVVRWTTKNAGWNAMAADMFQQWMEGDDPDELGNPNITGLTTFIDDLREIARAWQVDGDISAVKVKDSAGRGCIQLIEAERLSNPKSLATEAYAIDGGNIVGGVEFAGNGSFSKIHVSQWDRTATNTTMITKPIDGESVWFLPNPARFRAGQVRGEPGLQAGLRMFELLNNYFEDTAVAATIATYFSVIFQSQSPAEMQGIMSGMTPDQPTRDNTNQPEEVMLGPGMIGYAKPGEVPVQMKPEQPTTNFKDFMHAGIQIIGADLGLPLAILLYLSEQMSFSNLRGTLAMAGRGFDHARSVLARFVRMVARWKVQEWIAQGKLPTNEAYTKVSVVFPPMPVVDLQMEVDAYATAVEKNLMTQGQAIELLGFGTSHDAIIKTRASEREKELKLGVAPADMPGATRPGQGGDAPAPTDQTTSGATQ